MVVVIIIIHPMTMRHRKRQKSLRHLILPCKAMPLALCSYETSFDHTYMLHIVGGTMSYLLHWQKCRL